MFEDDYNLKKLKRVETKGTNIDFFVTPRFENHYVLNEYEPYSIDLLSNYLKENSTFVDIGAHYGYFSLVAFKAKKNIKVIAIEPVKENATILEKNFAINNLKNYEIFENIASNKEATIDYNISEASDSSSIYVHPLAKVIETRTIKSIIPDTILENKNNIDFIKIDVEGHEIQVLEGLKKTIKNNTHLKLLIEFNPKCQLSAGFKENELIECIENQGFDVYLVSESQKKCYRLSGSKYTWTDFIPKDSYCNLLCIPKKDSISVAFISHTSELGGAERSLLELITDSQQYTLISNITFPNKKGAFIDKIQHTGISYQSTFYSWFAGIQNKTSDDLLIDSTKNIIELKTLIEKINPHIIYTNTAVIPWGALLSKQLNKPHIWHINEFVEKDHGLKIKTDFKDLCKLIEISSEKVIFNSKAVENEYLQYFSNKEKGKTIYYNIKIPKFKKISSSKVFNYKNSLKLGIFGGISEGKGQKIAAQATVDLISRGLDVELLIMGSYDKNSNYFQQIDQIAEVYKDRIHVKNFELNPFSYMSLVDTVLVCSKNEAFGRVTAEGMLLKKPIIGSNSGGTKELIEDGKNGFLFNPNNIDDLKINILKIYDNRELINSLGNNGKNIIEKIFSKSYSKSTIEILQSFKNYKIKYPKIIKLIFNLLSQYISLNNQKEITYNSINNSFIKLKNHFTSLTTIDDLLNKEYASLKTDYELINNESKSYKNILYEINQNNNQLKESNNKLYCNALKIESQINEITSSKFYKLWQKFNKLKKIIKNEI